MCLLVSADLCHVTESFLDSLFSITPCSPNRPLLTNLYEKPHILSSACPLFFPSFNKPCPTLRVRWPFVPFLEGCLIPSLLCRLHSFNHQSFGRIGWASLGKVAVLIFQGRWCLSWHKSFSNMNEQKIILRLCTTSSLLWQLSCIHSLHLVHLRLRLSTLHLVALHP